ncbi:HIT family protein [Camelimonas abortus]|uniref:HIT family protein n=1 Tax=Camelimonas abortus TaxID=1017184 RepID=A0ABV7LE70_9HYPH
MAAYDPKNVFAAILKGQLPSHKVYEDELTYAFMDIMPRADGHVLVIPKAPSRNILDIEPEDLAAVARTVKKVAMAARETFRADGVTILQSNEPAAGQVVFHTHFHVLPRWNGVELRPGGQEVADPEVLARQAEQLRKALEGC